MCFTHVFALTLSPWAIVKAELVSFTHFPSATDAGQLALIQMRADRSRDASVSLAEGLMHEAAVRRRVNCVACTQAGQVWCSTAAMTETGEHELGHCTQPSTLVALSLQCFNFTAECPASPRRPQKAPPRAAFSESSAITVITILIGMKNICIIPLVC